MFWRMTMTPELETWLTALESGEWTQARQQLRVGHKYCCLGVACELYRPTNPDSDWTSESAFSTGKIGPIDFERLDITSTNLPRRVAAWLGLKDSFETVEQNPRVLYLQNYVQDRTTWLPNLSQLAGLNDNGYSFTDIARVIRANLRGEISSLDGSVVRPLTAGEIASN